MKNIKFLFSILFVALLAGCSDDSSDATFIEGAPAPQNLSALFTITHDNTGMVTIAPHGEGISGFDIYFGDGTAAPASVGVGGKATHAYAEGHYEVKVVGMALNGKTTEVILPLDVMFIAPENLDVTVATVVGNPYQINVTATADYETYFEVMYGEDPAQTPEQFNEGDIVSHTYSATGTYTVTVTAYSGGAATTTYTQNVTISNPLLLPINFENPSLNYAFTDFNGNVSAVVNNPDVSGINTSAKVASATPSAGNTWTGGFLTLDSPIDFAQGAYFRVKVWSPAAGVPVLLKLENLNDGGVATELTAVTTVANQWEELIYNFSGANQANQYSKLVFFFNAGNPGTGDTYYFDDIVQSSAGVPLTFPLTFESAALDYDFTDFLGSYTELVNNPVPGGINTSSKVMSFFKPNGSDVWAGTFILMSDPVDFSSQQKIKMKVYSPTAGTPIIFKFENEPNSASIERNVSTTVANQWEEITFDFTGIVTANNYQRVVIFFGAGQPGTGATYYFDDIKLTN